LSLHHLLDRTNNPELLICEGSLLNEPITILFDGGANPSYIRQDLTVISGLTLHSTNIQIKLADGSIIDGQRTSDLDFSLFGDVFHDSHSFIAAPIAYDIILGIDWLRKHNPQINWRNSTMHLRGQDFHCRIPRKLPDTLSLAQLEAIIPTLGSEDYLGMAIPATTDVTLRTTALQDEADRKIFENLPEPIKHLVEQYPNVFKTFDGLPPSRSTDHAIELINEQMEPPHRPIYPMTSEELSTLREELDFLLKHGRIRNSTSPYGAPVFFVKQKDKLRLVFDYRALNSNTVKNRTPLPPIIELLDRLSKARYFTLFDLVSGYHQILIKDGHQHKTAFRTKYGHFEWMVMPFGLCNAPPTFQTTINNIFQDVIDKFLSCYIDDLLIFSETFEDHINHITLVLQRLNENKMHLRLRKCTFLATELDYLGYKISQGIISVQPRRLTAIKDFETPKSYSDLRSFIGLANTIHRFVHQHAALLAPLSDLLRNHKTKPFHWTPDLQRQFEDIKTALCKPDQLAMFDSTKPVHIYTDWSERAIGSYVAQPDATGIEQPIAYSSRKLSREESRYSPYMGEMLALVEALKTHRQYLLNSTVYVFTDHASLRHLLDQPKLRPMHHRWLADILSVDFQIQIIPGKWNSIADALSRRRHTDDVAVNTDMDATYFINSLELVIDDDLLNEIKNNLSTDDEFQEISQYLVDPNDPQTYSNAENVPKQLKFKLSRYVLRNGLLYYIDKTHARLFVPENSRTRIIQLAHSEGPQIHNNWEMTAERITRFYHWPLLHKDVLKFVQQCDDCQRTKIARRHPYGLLQPHEIPPSRWHTISMDFATKLPSTRKGNDTIMVIVDSATKRTRIIPTTESSTATEIANTFIEHVWKHHGIPRHIISDRDSKFMSKFWEQLCKSLKIKQTIATAYHQQTDGQSENKIGWIKQSLRNLCNFWQDDWDEFLHIIEFCINDTVNSSTGYTPFFLEYGRHPTSLLDLSLNVYDSFDLRELQSAYQIAKDNVRNAQDQQAYFANKRRLEAPFAIDDLVLLSLKDFRPPNLRDRPSHKLSDQYSGPYRIKNLIGSVPLYELDIPNDWHIHNVFHPEKLKRYYYDTEGKHPLDAAPVANRTIERILALRSLQGREQALIKWLNHSPVFNCWLDITSELKARYQKDKKQISIDSVPFSNRTLPSFWQEGVMESSRYFLIFFISYFIFL
jgi:hypothetical protein